MACCMPSSSSSRSVDLQLVRKKPIVKIDRRNFKFCLTVRIGCVKNILGFLRLFLETRAPKLNLFKKRMKKILAIILLGFLSNSTFGQPVVKAWAYQQDSLAGTRATSPNENGNAVK